MSNFARQDMNLLAALSAFGGFLLGGWFSLTFLQGAFAGAAWAGIIGAVVGGTIGFAATTLHDQKQRQQEISELKASLYAEIADRSGRCINDYLEPWRNFSVTAANNLNSERVGKFRPTDPVVFPSIAGKMGLLEPEVLLAVTQFYFRLDAVRQAIESLQGFCEKRETPGGLPVVESGDHARAELIAIRFRSCFDPALRALERLEPSRASEFDLEVTRVYPHLRASNLTLRSALRKYL
jgi:hypothetical protein